MEIKDRKLRKERKLKDMAEKEREGISWKERKDGWGEEIMNEKERRGKEWN